ncbi:methylated-DNA--[protein]-cysteine S-methyltransferase [Dyadobacter arcticus]|uniref:Methylated-DNA--protein-cysteine methyltransferase n=1 Tax=Dyadobacter arcticus TaxID=1078754 RepID=A0ABX0UR81_9BACT|nr:methylated-DNA--[protein]-cysteine S-methyltransferase [Dyadobacter arcticus]NIJ54175.1 methylated-DNA-[protein]-cysteine S-methyltransferase [Dyadobacter arcticus]
MEYYFKTIDSPVGRLTLIASEKGLNAVRWERVGQQLVGSENHDHPIILEAEKQLGEYFSKNRKSFSLPLDFEGTEFQKKVWEALLTIPFGETRTYGDIARQIENPDAVRAVGGAANKNPIAIIAPCHRVIGATGKLVGFGGGIANKTILLNIESVPSQLSLW